MQQEGSYPLDLSHLQFSDSVNIWLLNKILHPFRLFLLLWLNSIPALRSRLLKVSTQIVLSALFEFARPSQFGDIMQQEGSDPLDLSH